jgi:hypothetical protein
MLLLVLLFARASYAASTVPAPPVSAVPVAMHPFVGALQTVGSTMIEQLRVGLKQNLRESIVDPMVTGISNYEDENSMVRVLLDQFDQRLEIAHSFMRKFVHFIVIVSAVLGGITFGVSWFYFDKSPFDAAVQKIYWLCVSAICIITICVVL